VGIVDATTFVKFHEAEIYGRFFEDQITSSDVVLVNKTDLTNSATVDQTVELIGRINERAVVVPTVHAVLDFEPPASDHSTTAEHGHFPVMHLETVTLRSPNSVDFHRWERLFEKLANGKLGSVKRAKALVQTDRGPYRFDLSSGRVDVAPFDRDVPESCLVVIGDELNEGLIRRAIEVAP
jgi:G3E family GTPase